ncbi:hypothetical protein IEQ34_001408 [Dendrobium chrysotoxum]|uniref:Uncharacterized protein n=1 Tax=Dendrobium chrysotoxum TaxID=161865 RepID=A0AAV7HRF6_DENCH|nr:hypothetical protein IEQ34_001408 [Dendrobium chrysotoxum]
MNNSSKLDSGASHVRMEAHVHAGQSQQSGALSNGGIRATPPMGSCKYICPFPSAEFFRSAFCSTVPRSKGLGRFVKQIRAFSKAGYVVVDIHRFPQR